MHPAMRNDPVRVPTGTARRIHSMDANDREVQLSAGSVLAAVLLMSGFGGDGTLEQLTRSKHGMHDNG